MSHAENATQRVPYDIQAMTDPQVAPHPFVGRGDRWCTVCDRPDRNPIHAGAA